MKRLSNVKIGTKLVGGFLMVAIIAAIIGAIGIAALWKVNGMADTMYSRETVGLRHTAEASQNVLNTARALRNSLLASANEYRDNNLEEVDHFLQNISTELDEAQATFTTDEEKAMVARAREALKDYEVGVREVMAQVRTEPLATQRRSVELLNENVRLLADDLNWLMTDLIERKQANADQLSQETHTVYRFSLITLSAFTLVGILLGLFSGIMLTRGLTRQLGGEPRTVASTAEAIATGDLTTHIDTSRANAGSVIRAMQRMQDSLTTIVTAVRSSSDHIAAGSSQINHGNADLSQRTEQQAANITQTAAAMEQLSSTVKSNAEAARQATMLANSATTAAVEGGTTVGNVVVTMEEINTSSRQIVDIIGVINSIAFQTNILALNAAVEAARAGEEGRGFAVVASEVRNLAQRSAAAAKDIEGLIRNSVEKVESGRQQVDSAGKAVTAIVTQVRQLNDIIHDISAATAEQAAGVTEINHAVGQLSDVTQQNAALVNESVAAAGSLHEQATTLVGLVGRFVTRNHQIIDEATTPLEDHNHTLAALPAN